MYEWMFRDCFEKFRPTIKNPLGYMLLFFTQGYMLTVKHFLLLSLGLCFLQPSV
jgi:hypothetical protein